MKTRRPMLKNVCTMLPQLKFLSPLVLYNSISIRKQASDDTLVLLHRRWAWKSIAWEINSKSLLFLYYIKFRTPPNVWMERVRLSYLFVLETKMFGNGSRMCWKWSKRILLYREMRSAHEKYIIETTFTYVFYIMVMENSTNKTWMLHGTVEFFKFRIG